MSGDKQKQKMKKWAVTGVVFLGFCCALVSGLKHMPAGEEKENRFTASLFESFGRQIEKTYFMLPDFLENGESVSSLDELAVQAMLREIPIYRYALKHMEEEETEDTEMAEMIRGEEGLDEDTKNIEEENLDYGEDALHIENSILEEMEKENSLYQEQTQQAEEEPGLAEGEADGMLSENLLSDGFQTAAYPAYTYDWSEKWGYDSLISNFYAVDNSTSLKEEYISLNQLLYQDLSVDKSVEGPQILIYHTHSQEGFADSVPGDSSTTIVGAGEKLARLLQDKYGFRVLHHMGEYDVENRQDAYSNSLPAIEKVLADNPSIEVVIDVHRDEMREGKKLVMDLQGRPTARFMFFNGLSYIRNKGDIGYLENPYIQDNLAFSFQAQVAANEYYPGIARKVYLKAYRYNMHLKPKSMLIELGAQTNTVEEIMNACDPLAHIIAIVLDDNL